MRYFILLLLACSPLLASSQDSLVCIPPAAARWYLEASEERWVLREKDSLNQQLVLTLNQAILVKDQVIVTYENDTREYLKQNATLLDEIRLKEEEIDTLEKSVRTQKLLKFLAVVGIVIAAVL